MKLTEILRGYEEITFTDGEDELMVHYDVSSGKPVRAYVYNDSPLLNFDYDAYDLPKKAKDIDGSLFSQKIIRFFII